MTTSQQRLSINFSITLIWSFRGFTFKKPIKINGQIKKPFRYFLAVKSDLNIFLYIDFVGIWSWLSFSGNFAMICMGNVFTVFDPIRFCMKQSRQNSWAKWRFFQALTGGKICMLLNIPVLIWQSFDFGTIISGQVLVILIHYCQFSQYCPLHHFKSF